MNPAPLGGTTQSPSSLITAYHLHASNMRCANSFVTSVVALRPAVSNAHLDAAFAAIGVFQRVTDILNVGGRFGIYRAHFAIGVRLENLKDDRLSGRRRDACQCGHRSVHSGAQTFSAIALATRLPIFPAASALTSFTASLTRFLMSRAAISSKALWKRVLPELRSVGCPGRLSVGVKLLG